MNKLTVEFLGWKQNNDNYYLPSEFVLIKEEEISIESNWCEILIEQDTCRLEEMLFDKSWDWLIPVIDKIKNLGVCYGEELYKYIEVIDENLLSCEISATYESVLQFIKEYNEQRI